MIGFITYRNGHEFRIPDYLIFNLNINHGKLVVEGNGYFFLLQTLKKGEEYDFLISEFNEPSEIITRENNLSVIDHGLIKLIHDDNWKLEQDLNEFRRLEAILKEERVI